MRHRLAYVLATLLTLLTTAPTPAAAATGSQGGNFHALPPARILDTRDGTGLGPICGRAGQSTLGAGTTLAVPVLGCGGIPYVGVTAIVITATVTNTTEDGYLTIFPDSKIRPTASNLNWRAGRTVANLVVAGLSSQGKVAAYNYAGQADVIWDVAGWISDTQDQARAGGFQPMLPARLLDTRGGLPLLRGQTLRLQVTGRAGVDIGTASAAVMNLTATNGSAPGYLTVWPGDGDRPTASNVNFDAGQTVAARAVVQLGTGGGVNIWSPVDVDVVVDLNGTFSTETAPQAGGRFVATTPTRFLDTRRDMGATGIGGGGAVVLPIAGHGGIPSLDSLPSPIAVVANVTVTGPAAAGYSSIWAEGERWPGTSDLNFDQGQTVPNLVVVQLNKSGAIRILNHGECSNVVVDVVGWFTGPVTSATPADPSIWPCPPPPGPAPTQLIIPKIGVNAPVEQGGYDLTIPAPAAPQDPNDVAWYRYGPTPGARGHALMNGHVDWWTGPSVFWNLRNLRGLDDIYVQRSDGSTVHFTVVANLVFDAKSPPDDMYATDVPGQLWLITCDGYFTGSAGYTERRLVIADLA